MALVVIVIGTIAELGIFEHAVCWLEAGIIVLVGVFWIVRTSELWEVTP